MKVRVNTARTGALWVKLGMKAFFRQPLALSGLFFMFMALISVMSIVPVIGNVLALALLPAASVGLMAATSDAIRGRFPMPALLLSAYTRGKDVRQAMLVLGAVYACGFLIVIGISALVDGGSFAKMYLTGAGINQETLLEPDFQLAMWVALVLYLPLSLTFWHAPALVYWCAVPPVKSMFFSFVACERNFLALSVFGLTWLGTFLLAGVTVTTLSAFAGGADLAGTLMFPTAMVLAAMFFSSTYFTFCDCFDLTEFETP